MVSSWTCEPHHSVFTEDQIRAVHCRKSSFQISWSGFKMHKMKTRFRCKFWFTIKSVFILISSAEWFLSFVLVFCYFALFRLALLLLFQFCFACQQTIENFIVSSVFSNIFPTYAVQYGTNLWAFSMHMFSHSCAPFQRRHPVRIHNYKIMIFAQVKGVQNTAN